MDPERGGGGGGQGFRTPLKIHKNIGFLINTGPDPLQITCYQACIQCRAIIGTPAKCHLNGISLVGRWWPAYRGIWILSPLIYLKKQQHKTTLVAPLLPKFSETAHVRDFEAVQYCHGWFLFFMGCYRDHHLLFMGGPKDHHNLGRVIFRNPGSFLHSQYLLSYTNVSFPFTVSFLQ